MIRIRDITLPLEHDKGALLYHAAQALHIRTSEIASLQIFRRSLDARKKPQLKWVYTVDVTLRSGESRVLRQCRSNKITREEPYVYRVPKAASDQRPVVVGFGPAGMFAALVLALSGLKPIVLERGDPAPERREKVEKFWNGGALDPESNVQFGEGGAGTFSDGKLHTGTKNERGRWVLEQFVKAGAQEEILYDAKPHVGTDVLFEVVQNLRKRIISIGGEVRFGARLTGLHTEGGALCGAEYVQGGETKSRSGGKRLRNSGTAERSIRNRMCSSARAAQAPSPTASCTRGRRTSAGAGFWSNLSKRAHRRKSYTTQSRTLERMCCLRSCRICASALSPSAARFASAQG